MRTIKEIKKDITTRFMANAVLADAYGFQISSPFEQEFSLLSFESILFDIISTTIFILESLFDQHEKEVTTEIFEQKVGRPTWYRNKALTFQFGFDLIPDTDLFNNQGFTEDQIASSRIVKYAAVTESENESRVIIKIAGEQGNELAPITSEQLTSFRAYIKDIKFSGTQVTVINFLPDRLFLNLEIYRDPLVIDANGISIINGNVPVEDALREFMKELPFDGELIIQNLVDKLQLVPGVEIVNVINVQTSWIDPQTNDYGTPETVNVKRIPESGYFQIVDFNNIRYVV